MPAPSFTKTVIENDKYTLSIYAASVKLEEKKGNTFKRYNWRIALKPAASINTCGELFKVSKLIIRAQEGTFEKLITLPDIQQWLFETCIKYVQAHQTE